MCAGSYAPDVLPPLFLGRVQLSLLSVCQQYKVTLRAYDTEVISLIVAGQRENDFIGVDGFHINHRMR